MVTSNSFVCDFNPRSREGSDLVHFQHLGRPGNFNPRSREGSDPAGGLFFVLPWISIHAPARGATGSPGPPPPSSRISIHAPARGATPVKCDWANKLPFQSTLPRGERRGLRRVPALPVDFNPRSREGSDDHHFSFYRFGHPFQSTLPRGERLIVSFVPSSKSLFQSTLPRGERLPGRSRSFGPGLISIHAPARGATQRVEAAAQIVEISIHAPARGATHDQEHLEACQKISIHAPARGATCGGRKPAPGNQISIHAPARGATRTAAVKSFGVVFQSTLPRGERRSGQKHRSYRCWISIHAPARGATTTLLRIAVMESISIHAPARGATLWGNRSRAERSISIHAPARGATGHGWKNRRQ